MNARDAHKETGRFTRRLHFVGIAGSGMSSLAEWQLAQGRPLSGSDLRDTPACEALQRQGAVISRGHAAEQAHGAAALVVSSAVSQGNPELVYARSHGIPIISRGALLAELMRPRIGVAVAGTHGKTTSAALITHLLEKLGADPCALLGGRISGARLSGARIGKGPVLVAEADESDGSFLQLAPRVAVITNIEAEHLDYHVDAAGLDDAFLKFAKRLPAQGCAVLGVDDPGVQRLLSRIDGKVRVRSFGFGAQADLRGAALQEDSSGVHFEVHDRGACYNARSPLPGLHNAANALAALAVVEALGMPLRTATEALADFPGVERRFESLGERSGVRVVDDYGHHPSEVRAALQAARSSGAKRVVVVFQPHRYTRTRDCFDAFTSAFDEADLLLLTEVYAAGESPLAGATGEDLADAIHARGKTELHFTPELKDAEALLQGMLAPGDLLLTLGAGDVRRVGEAVWAQLAGGPAR